MKIENHNYTIIYIILSAIVIILTPFALLSDRTIWPLFILGDCLMVSCIFLTRKGTGMNEIPFRHGVEQ